MLSRTSFHCSSLGPHGKPIFGRKLTPGGNGLELFSTGVFGRDVDNREPGGILLFEKMTWPMTGTGPKALAKRTLSDSGIGAVKVDGRGYTTDLSDGRTEMFRPSLTSFLADKVYGPTWSAHLNRSFAASAA